jgi:hypothetical protein
VEDRVGGSTEVRAALVHQRRGFFPSLTMISFPVFGIHSHPAGALRIRSNGFGWRHVVGCLAMLAIFSGSAAFAQTARQIAQWDIFELELKGPSDGNPDVEVQLDGDFSDGSRTVEAAGFYDGDGVYRIRFMPDKPGDWHYETKSNRWPLTGKLGSFRVTPAAGKNHGPVRVHNTYHFAYADGTPFRQIGTTAYNWVQESVAQQELTLKTLASAPFNKVRMLVFPQDQNLKGRETTVLAPYEGKAPHDWNYARFNPAYFRRLEQRVGQMRDLNIEADLILFHPYGKMWGFDSMDAAADARYLRYVVARLSAYRNVWWSMSNEYDFLRTKSEEDWDRIFQIVQHDDPYGHLRSIHNGLVIYNNNQPWVTHVSLQNGSAVEDPGRAVLYRDVYRKPIVFDEVKYEGNNSARWGQLTAEEMVHRFWAGTVAGTYVGHGDCYVDAPGGAFMSHGGELHGESPARLAFLRQIMEDGPADGIDPIDKWQDERIGGEAGEYYLVYFGHAAPTSFPFQLYKSGLSNGQIFQVEVIDTWGMTTTKIAENFTLKKKDSYYFVDRDARAVPLPGKPYMALRIRRVGGAQAQLSGDKPIEP